MIEEALARILLPGKRLFETKQRFVNYGYEGCIGDNSPIIIEFLEKYPQEPLTPEQEQLLFHYKDKNSQTVEKIMLSMQKLIFYINKNNFRTSELMHTIISNLPQYVHLQSLSLFEANANFKVNQLIRIFDYFEQVCFNTIQLNLITAEQTSINEASLLKIKDFVKNTQGYILINKVNLSTAVRRFISRKLCGQRADTEFKSTSPLSAYLLNVEYWSSNALGASVRQILIDQEKTYEELLAEELIHLGESLGLLVSHAVDLYNKLEEDDCLLIKKSRKEPEVNAKKKKKTTKKYVYD